MFLGGEHDKLVSQQVRGGDSVSVQVNRRKPGIWDQAKLVDWPVHRVSGGPCSAEVRYLAHALDLIRMGRMQRSLA
jgi:hypothetical protein